MLRYDLHVYYNSAWPGFIAGRHIFCKTSVRNSQKRHGKKLDRFQKRKNISPVSTRYSGTKWEIARCACYDRYYYTTSISFADGIFVCTGHGELLPTVHIENYYNDFPSNTRSHTYSHMWSAVQLVLKYVGKCL